jgi:hypothetical protein
MFLQQLQVADRMQAGFTQQPGCDRDALDVDESFVAEGGQHVAPPLDHDAFNSECVSELKQHVREIETLTTTTATVVTVGMIMITIMNILIVVPPGIVAAEWTRQQRDRVGENHVVATAEFQGSIVAATYNQILRPDRVPQRGDVAEMRVQHHRPRLMTMLLMLLSRSWRMITTAMQLLLLLLLLLRGRRRRRRGGWVRRPQSIGEQWIVNGQSFPPNEYGIVL